MIMLKLLLLLKLTCYTVLAAASESENYNKADKCIANVPRPRDCMDLKYYCPTARSGVYTVYPPHSEPGYQGLRVRCDMTTSQGGWTVFQSRSSGSVDFYRDFDEYKSGFGDVSADFWMGLENIHKLTLGGNFTLRIDMTDFDDIAAYATYKDFSIGP